MTTVPRDRPTDILRGVAVLLVVLDHASGLVATNTTGMPSAVGILNDAAGPFRMATLMFLSGMLVPRSLEKRPSAYVRGKLRHVAWPYLVWSAVVLGLLTVTAGLTGDGVPGETVLRVFYDPPTYLWFLGYLLVYYLVALVVPVRAHAVLAGAALAVAALPVPGDAGRLAYLAAFFFLGSVVFCHRERWRRRPPRRGVLVVAVLAAGAAAVASTAGHEVRYDPLWSPAVVGGVVAGVAAATTLAPTGRTRAVEALGRSSVVYYVTHWVVALVAVHVLLRSGFREPTTLLVVTVALALATGWAADRLRARSRLVSALFAFPELGRAAGRHPAGTVRDDATPARAGGAS
ncbi:acyltransferase family protein [Cellulosimicrobium cellulans]|uniref:acyltransferase family protein n=1 Tax=Cellulosimicrobium cellulans TaxID=1710 RepID=UPI0025B77922|nr:acyltransferase [Cellulosimicrobium cellulans]